MSFGQDPGHLRKNCGANLQCLHGGAAFVWPVIQAFEYLDLTPMQIEIPLEGALSKEKIKVNVPSSFTVGISTEPESWPMRLSVYWVSHWLRLKHS
ncbi:MAG: SPFH domain-containing protein [Verrucomicrobiales bacterium]